MSRWDTAERAALGKWWIVLLLKRIRRKVMFSQAYVSHSVHSRFLSTMGQAYPLYRQTPYRQIRDTVNKRALCILLECILLYLKFNLNNL